MFETRRFILSLLLTISLAFAANAQTEAGFVNSSNEPHYVLITMTKTAVDIPDVRAEVTKYMWKYHAADKLSISHILIGENRSVGAMFIKEFRNAQHAMNFHQLMLKNKPDFMQMGLTKNYFVVSKSNFDQILRNRSLSGYDSFFQENYLK